VEVLACGTPEAVQALCEWLWTGPPAAQVAAVEVETVEARSLGEWPASFQTC
jgi:acylphosphatase